MAACDRRLNAVKNTTSERHWEEIPPRWISCPAVGKVVSDLFLPFKTPLNSKYDGKIADLAKRFTVEDVFDTAEQQGRRISLWINVAPERFYEKTEITKHSTKYIQPACEECPSEEETRIFIESCENYHNDRSDALIGVHSIHGYNRTGFLICAYLVEVLKCSVEDAIAKFAKARPHGIYRADYLDTLRRRYSGDPDNHPAVPDVPNWCYEEEKDRLDGGVNLLESGGDRDRSTREAVPKRSKKVSRFMEGVPGVVYLEDAARVKAVRKQCSRLCGWKGYAGRPFVKSFFPRMSAGIPGQTNINMIADQPYRVSCKADGFRYMLLIDGKNNVYFLGRNSEVFLVEGMNFPCLAGSEPYAGAHLADTLLDGELVMEKVDAQRNEDKRIMNFDARCHRIKSGIMEPRNRLALEGVFDKNTEPFNIRQMDFYPVKLREENGFVNMPAKFLEQEFRRQLTHNVDGLVFQPYDMAYIPGSCARVLKWKPPSQCTVDFLLRVEKSVQNGETARTTGQLFVGGRDAPFGALKWSDEFDQLDGQIIECRYDRELRQWIFERMRPDKSSPNHHKTARDVFKAIEHPVTQEELVNCVNDKVPYFEDKIRKRTQITIEHRKEMPASRRHNFENRWRPLDRISDR